ncbi:unnamed protein product [Amoebophrya sp. A25]|nr:unnamed protein product [Amoebophrya sp. A25]|eukprot:GSA25T00027873001.1
MSRARMSMCVYSPVDTLHILNMKGLSQVVFIKKKGVRFLMMKYPPRERIRERLNPYY